MREETISLEEVKKVATLCKLSFSDDEYISFQKDLAAILKYIASLREVDTREIEPTFMVLPKKNVFDHDDSAVSLSREKVLANAKNKDSAYIRTKVVL